METIEEKDDKIEYLEARKTELEAINADKARELTQNLARFEHLEQKKQELTDQVKKNATY